MTTYTVKLDSHEDGVGEQWAYLQALEHIRRCEYDEKGIVYTIVEHESEQELEPTAEIQPAESKRRRQKSSPESSG